MSGKHFSTPAIEKMAGIIIKAISGFFYVHSNGTTFECRARGSFRNKGTSPVVGDKVEFTAENNGKGIIESIKERKNYLSRPNIANIDRAFIVSSYNVPSPDTNMIDFLSAVCLFNNIDPVIVFNKCDMGSFEKFEKIYNNAGFKVLTVSAKTGENIDALESLTQNAVCAFIGNSGVGKSSIINAVTGDLDLKTGEVSEKLGRGRHTTRHTELFIRDNGGYIVDTPGFSTIDISDNILEFKNRLPFCFPEFIKYFEFCRFSDCRHISEKGCGVLKAVENGEISRSRHNSYKKIFEDYKDIRHWTIRK